MKTIGLIEIILYVKDMDRMVRFYRDVLDLPLSDAATRDFSNQDWITFETGDCRLVLHSGGSGKIGPDAPNVVFLVDEIKSARFQLLQAGVAISEIRTPAPGIQVCNGNDPEGNAFSVEEHKVG